MQTSYRYLRSRLSALHIISQIYDTLVGIGDIHYTMADVRATCSITTVNQAKHVLLVYLVSILDSGKAIVPTEARTPLLHEDGGAPAEGFTHIHTFFAKTKCEGHSQSSIGVERRLQTFGLPVTASSWCAQTGVGGYKVKRHRDPAMSGGELEVSVDFSLEASSTS